MDNGCPQSGVGGHHCEHYDADDLTPCCWCGVATAGEIRGEMIEGNFVPGIRGTNQHLPNCGLYFAAAACTCGAEDNP